MNRNSVSPSATKAQKYLTEGWRLGRKSHNTGAVLMAITSWVEGGNQWENQ